MPGLAENKKSYCDDLLNRRPEEVITEVEKLLLEFVKWNFLQSNGEETNGTNFVQEDLILDGERFHPLAEQPEILIAIKQILVDNLASLESSVDRSILTLRYVLVHQQILDEKSVILHDLAVSHISNIEANLENLQKEIKVEALLTIGYIHRMYYEYEKAKKSFERAEIECGLTTELTGCLGKRTYFQSFDVAQLVLKVARSRTGEIVGDGAKKNVKLPANVKLNDDTRMEKRKLTDEGQAEIPELTSLEQAVLLGLYARIEHLHADDEILHEELLAVLDVVLEHPSNFCIQLAALVLRSAVQKHTGRTVERCMMQYEELVRLVKTVPEEGEERTDLFFCTPVPPRWELQRQLANLFVVLGCVNSALDIYLRLELWEDVIICYKALELRHKGEEIVRQELAKGETPHLWCLLGECTDDIACFEKAWELSNHKSARAQRDIGMLFYQKKQFMEAIPHFKLSLETNSLQAPVWLRLAYVTLETEQWAESAAAYRHYCMLDSDNFEAWNNLAKCYVKLGQKSRAWKALQEATKLNYESWKVWDNFMAVSTDCGAFDEVIRAYTRILEIQEKHIDVDVLKILVKAIDENLPDNDGEPSRKYREKALKLFGHLTSKVPNNAQIWLLYSQLEATKEEKTPEVLEKVAGLLQKSHRCASQQPGWEKDSKQCLELLEISERLGHAHLDFARQSPDKTRTVQMLGSARLTLKSSDSKLELYKKSLIGALPDEVEAAHSRLKELIASIVETSSSFQ